MKIKTRLLIYNVVGLLFFLALGMITYASAIPVIYKTVLIGIFGLLVFISIANYAMLAGNTNRNFSLRKETTSFTLSPSGIISPRVSDDLIKQLILDMRQGHTALLSRDRLMRRGYTKSQIETMKDKLIQSSMVYRDGKGAIRLLGNSTVDEIIADLEGSYKLW